MTVSTLLATTAFLAGEVKISKFESTKQVQKDWNMVNDTVMGGVSQSSLQVNVDGHLQISGNLSYENKGGFVQVKCDNFPGHYGDNNTINVKMRGDGRKYYFQFIVQDDKGAVSGEFVKWHQTAENDWNTLSVSLDDMEWSLKSDDARPLKSLKDSKLFVMISIADDQKTKNEAKPEPGPRTQMEGPFKLEIESVTLSKKAG